MWSLVRRWRWGRRRRTARVVDESALGADGDTDGGAAAPAAGGAVVPPTTLGGALARALLALACAIRFDGADVSATEEAWAVTGWRPRAADEVSHLMVRESMRYAIYA